jgi:hypothetical protein
MRPNGAHGAGDTVGKTTAAERNENGIEIAWRSEHFEADGAIGGERGRIAHGVDVETLLVGKRTHLDGTPLVFDRADVDACAQVLQLLEFRLCSVARHDRGSANPSRRALHATPNALLPELVV